MFTIIITACYTSSIIAFVTLPIFPETVGIRESVAVSFLIIQLIRTLLRFNFRVVIGILSCWYFG